MRLRLMNMTSTAMCSQDTKVRSAAKNVLGSTRVRTCGTARGGGGGAGECGGGRTQRCAQRQRTGFLGSSRVWTYGKDRGGAGECGGGRL